MIDFIPGTFIPWVLSGLILLLVFALSVTTKSWREARRSPYYFLRVQAARKMQTYLAVSALLFLFIAVASVYAWQAPEDVVTRLAVLQNAKPTPAIAENGGGEEVAAEASPDVVTISLAPEDLALAEVEVETADSAVVESEPSAPPADIEPVAETVPSGGTNIGPIAFSTDITSNYQAIDPGQNFAQGFFTLYATFSYEGMDSDMSWSWQWKRNGQAIDGGEQQWAYGADGPGYVYLQPEEGFQPGEHSLEVWVGDQLMSQSYFTISEGVSASN